MHKLNYYSNFFMNIKFHFFFHLPLILICNAILTEKRVYIQFYRENRREIEVIDITFSKSR